MKFNRKQVRVKVLRSWLEILAKELTYFKPYCSKKHVICDVGSFKKILTLKYIRGAWL